MRATETKNGVTVNAVAGTRTVFLGLDLAEAKRAGCLGFAIQRHDPVLQETVWLRGRKTFAETDPGAGPWTAVPTFLHPVQDFWWADYEVEPGRSYTYKVVPRRGTPAALKSGAGVSVTVTTEAALGTPHSVFFNRGAIASQEYVHDFANVPPKDLKEPLQSAAYRYLSHGLSEALQAFLARAAGPEWEIHAAVYEFNWAPVLHALADARTRGAKVSIVYDAIVSDTGPLKASTAAIGEAKIADLCIARTEGKIMHNKFFVLTRAGAPVAVWTGSTNISENGIFGHLNVGHIVEDAAVAQAYRTYWEQLKDNPQLPPQRLWVNANSAIPPLSAPAGTPVATVFSPRTGAAGLKRYAEIAGSASQALCMTFAFGMNEVFKEVYRRDDGILRLALLEDYGTAAEAQKVKALQARRNVVIAIGGNIPTNGFDTWLAESPGIGQNVQWVHTKFMLVDPLSEAPLVITGSANFSPDSTSTNDENMLVIRGDRRVADIYFTEYMRLFAHYGFREAVGIAIKRAEPWHPSHLNSDPAAWQAPYFTPGSDREIRRRYFATGKAS